MTSKNLFFKLIRQDLKKRIWCPILIFLGYFLALEIQLLNYLDRMDRRPSNYNYTKMHYLANTFFSPDNNSMIIVITMFVGAVCALSGYAYLHSKKQLDTYHSMPVKREVLFFSHYVSGVLMYVIPFIVHIGICLLFAVTNGAWSGHGLVNAIGFAGINILSFLLVYSLCIVAICLTGNLLISILGSGVLVGYSTILSLIQATLYEQFFHTYMDSFREPIWAFSPVGMMEKLFEIVSEYRDVNTGFSYWCILPYSGVILLAVLIFTLFGVLLYKKRATEAAGKPIAFTMAEPFLYAMVVLPSTIVCGLFIQQMIDYDSFGWFVFGLAFSFVIVAVVMEAIFRLDIKGAFRHWKRIVFNGVCLILTVVIFKYDVLGYNTYVPNDKELAGCAVSIGGLMNINTEERVEPHQYYRYTSALDYRFEHMNILDNPSAMALARKAAAENLQYMQFEYYEGIEKEPMYQKTMEKEQHYREISVQYTKKNGEQIHRRYNIDLSDQETLGLLADIFADTDYKLGAFPILTNGWKKEYTELYCMSNDFAEKVKLSPQRQARLMEVYQSELSDLTLDEVIQEIPLGNIAFNLGTDSEYKNSYGGGEDGYKIYPAFTATVELLKEYGFDYTAKREPEQVIKIEVRRRIDLTEEDTEVKVFQMTNGVTTEAVAERVDRNWIQSVYTDEASKEAILSSIVNRELSNGVEQYAQWDEIQNAYEVIVYYEEDGLEECRSYDFFDDQIPDFVETDYEKELETFLLELQQ